MTTITFLAFTAGITIASAWVTSLVRRAAIRRGIIDHPNARSSHSLPTARGGGLAIVLLASAAILVLWTLGFVGWRLPLALLAGGGAVAVVGHLDDRGRVGVGARMLVHFGAAILAVWLVGGLRQLDFGSFAVSLGVAGNVISVLGVVWALNLFNFMDGIDGIAALQAIFMAGAGAALALLAGISNQTPAVGLVLAAASLGFLVWNWPPARIFMGDVGSGFLGFVLAVIALAAMRERGVMLPIWLILSGVFLIDSTVTLLRRLARRERVYEAHRSHAYQWQARRWNSHLRVTIASSLLNLLWLAPWAWLCVRFPAYSGWFVVVAWGPLIALAIVCGSGRREVRS